MASSSTIPEVPLTSSSKKAIPVVGLGTAEYPFGASALCMKEAILDAIRIGYRHFDSSAVYLSEQYIGQAVKEALSLGLIKSRDELFITSKLWCSDTHRDRVLPALQKTLENLELEYIDLYLVHWPVCLKPGEIDFPVKKENLVAIDLKSVWEAMEECHKLGFAKSIGVSNFSCKKLEALLATAKIPPAVDQTAEERPGGFSYLYMNILYNKVPIAHGIILRNFLVFRVSISTQIQVEMNPLWQQKKLREFAKEKGIHITAYSPLGGKGAIWGSNLVMDCEVLKQIANEKGKTVAQVCLRWVYEQGVIFLVKSFNKERMKDNLDIFNWKLSVEESEKISRIPQRRGFLAEEFISDDGPYKSVEDLWDGEV